MKGEIAKNGVLYKERAGVMKNCCCSVRLHNDFPIACDDYCPAFREPVRRDDGKVELQLCREVGVLVFDEFEDKRECGENG